MEKLNDIVPAEVKEDFQKISEMGLPGIDRNSLWGYNFFPGLSADAAQYAYEEWTPRKTDVFLATYPKTGTNFGIEVLIRILYQDEKMLSIMKLLPPPFSFIEFHHGNKFPVLDKLMMKRRLMATHLPPELINMEKIKKVGAKIIYILRNPKDQMVSWMKYCPKLSMGQVEPWKSMVNSGWDKYFEHAVKGDFAMNSKPGEWYPENILSWYKHKDNKTVKFVSFEDLKNDPKTEIKQIAEFLEIPISDEKIEKIAAETSFNKMKQNHESLENSMRKGIRDLAMRKGEVGGWREYFTVSQSECIDAIFEEKLKDTDIRFIYK